MRKWILQYINHVGEKARITTVKKSKEVNNSLDEINTFFLIEFDYLQRFTV
jgi:hypothetical protein